jgi:hypothetical protein
MWEAIWNFMCGWGGTILACAGLLFLGVLAWIGAGRVGDIKDKPAETEESKDQTAEQVTVSKRREIEKTYERLLEENPTAAAEYIFSNTPQYMNAISIDISDAIGTYNSMTVPWLVAELEMYADALREQLNDSGWQLVDSIKKAGTKEIIKMNVPRVKKWR